MIGPRLDEVGRLLSDQSRVVMISALMDGRQWTGRELARAANVMPSTASFHLQRLLDGALVSAVSHGRHKYYRIARPEVAQVLETLMALAPPPTVPRHATTRAIDATLRQLRTCYDHLAGRVAVELCDTLIERGAISLGDHEGSLTPVGTALFAELGIALDAEDARRPLCRPCLDWSERRYHLAGRAGVALAHRAFQRGWVVRHGSSRALEITNLGADALEKAFNFDCRGL